jgi:predicted alpha-1,2-mannosidase
MKTIVTFLLAIACIGATTNSDKASLVQWVDPFIGTDGHGHTYPGATLPFGMVQLSPDTRTDNWDACSGYHYSDKTIIGFSHTHLSGTGVGDYGDIRFMPVVGSPLLEPGSEESPESGYRSRFSHDDENASPGYYQVRLKDYDIKVELTATRRVGFHRYQFPASADKCVIVDLKNGITPDLVLAANLEIVGNRKIQGLRRTKGWAKDQYVFFTAEFSHPFHHFGIKKDHQVIPNLRKSTGKDLRAFLKFSIPQDRVLLVKVAISAVDVAGAEKNLQAEIPHWDFDKIKKQAEATWEAQLKKICITEPSEQQKKIFYTALYHTMVCPNLFMDVDGRYRGMDHKIHLAKNFTNYTVFSLWDTFRATHPLYTFIERQRSNDFVRTLLAKYDEGGILPIWELAANYTGCMIGYHAVPVIVDAYVNGIRDYDTEKAYAAIRHSSMQDQLGLKFYKKHGYIPAHMESDSVSKTLEYAYDDWCIARMARLLDKKADVSYFIGRAQFYKNIFDKETTFMRPKRNGNWLSPFDPREVNFNYTEANAWQYSFFVPHDVAGLISLYGGEKKFVDKLDQMFAAIPQTTGRKQADISGLIGQYAHGNEPSHHMVYLYSFAGAPWKTQEKVFEICRRFYSDLPDGLCGNEDCGQMSAWYVLSTLGWYPVCPGSGKYIITSPRFPQIILNMESGKIFKIKAEGVSEKNKYIQTAWLNGRPFDRVYLTAGDILAGGELRFKMGNQPNKKWGNSAGIESDSMMRQQPLVTTPVIVSRGKTFKDSCQIRLDCSTPESSIFYTLDGTDPTRQSKRYIRPFQLNKSSTVKVRGHKQGMGWSRLESASFVKISSDRDIRLLTSPSPQYPGNGRDTLIDSLRGPRDFRVGSWLGFHGKNMEAVVDLGRVEPVNQVVLGCLQNLRSWIFFPTQIDVYFSKDGRRYSSQGSITIALKKDLAGEHIRDFSIPLKGGSARFVKVVAKNIGVCPPWHAGRGEKAWIFVDEIMIR